MGIFLSIIQPHCLTKISYNKIQKERYPDIISYTPQKSRKKERLILHWVRLLIKKVQSSLLLFSLTVMKNSSLIWKNVYQRILMWKVSGNGSEALECIKEKYPDLVICGLMLHGMYGYELSSRLKTSGETSVIPIILYGSRIDIGQRNKREVPWPTSFYMCLSTSKI